MAKLIDNTYVWTFPNVKNIWEVRGTSLISDRFTLRTILTNSNMFDMDLKMVITEKNKNEIANSQSSDTCTCETKAKEQYISLHIEYLSCAYLQSIFKLTFSIIHPIERHTHIKSKMIVFDYKNSKYGFSDFITVGQMIELGFQDLTVHCTIEIVQKDLESYKPLLCNHRFSDVKIIIGDETYPAHKLILSISSEVFRVKFNGQDSISSLEINDMEPEVFKELLRFIYTGTVLYLETLASKLYIAAVRYGIYDLQTKCEKVLFDNLDEENVINTILLSQIPQNLHINNLYIFCMTFVARNLKTMISSGVCKELGEKDPEFLIDIVYHLGAISEKSTSKKNARSLVSVKSDRSDYFETFETFLNNKTHSDLTIHVGDNNFYAHKLILSIRSPVFSRMFENEMKETISGVVEIKDIEPDVFYELLRFMYTKKVSNIEDIASEVLLAADKYDVDDLKMKCENILLKKLTTENVSNVLLIADRANSTGLKDECLLFIIDYVYLHLEPDVLSYSMLNKILKALDTRFLLELLSKFAFDYELTFLL